MINDEMLPPYQPRPLLRFDRQRGARANYEVQWLRTPLRGTRLGDWVRSPCPGTRLSAAVGVGGDVFCGHFH